MQEFALWGQHGAVSAALRRNGAHVGGDQALQEGDGVGSGDGQDASTFENGEMGCAHARSLGASVSF